MDCSSIFFNRRQDFHYYYRLAFSVFHTLTFLIFKMLIIQFSSKPIIFSHSPLTLCQTLQFFEVLHIMLSSKRMLSTSDNQQKFCFFLTRGQWRCQEWNLRCKCDAICSNANFPHLMADRHIVISSISCFLFGETSQRNFVRSEKLRVPRQLGIVCTGNKCDTFVAMAFHEFA